MNKIILAKKAIGRPVMAVAQAQTLGKLKTFGVDPQTKRVESIVYTYKRVAYIVQWQHLAGVGQDAIMVADTTSAKAVQTPQEEAVAAGKAGLLGLTVYTELGNALGRITDFECDGATGEIIRIMAGDNVFDGAMLKSVGPMGAIVSMALDPLGDVSFVPHEEPKPVGELDAQASSLQHIPVGMAAGAVTTAADKEAARREALATLAPENDNAHGTGAYANAIDIEDAVEIAEDESGSMDTGAPGGQGSGGEPQEGLAAGYTFGADGDATSSVSGDSAAGNVAGSGAGHSDAGPDEEPNTFVWGDSVPSDPDPYTPQPDSDQPIQG